MKFTMAENKRPPVDIKTYDTLFDVVINVYCKLFSPDMNNPSQVIGTIAMGCNYAGITLAEAINLITNRNRERYHLEEALITPIVENVYQEHINKFGSRNFMYSLKVRNKFNADDWQKLPYIPDEVFEKIPKILKDGASQFNDKRERDIFLTGILGVISGLLGNVSGIYQKSRVYPNLFVFIVAPAGSGKGSLLFAKKMGMFSHNSTKEINEKTLIFIPANISSASIHEQLNDNGGFGILFETEADTMKSSFKQEWGGYSDLLRKAYHHEPVDLKRKDNNLYISIPLPKLSVVLSGTKSQINGIIQNTEDGLFSRFILYTFRSELRWNKCSEEPEISLDDFFEEQGQVLANILRDIPVNVEFKLTNAQKVILDNRFETWLKDFDLFLNDESLSIIKRLGLILFRIAMILTVLKNAENEHKEAEPSIIYYCDDNEFEIAFRLIEVYMQHSAFTFVLMATKKEYSINTRLQMFYDALPINEFKREQAVQIGQSEEIGIAASTVDKYLKGLVNSGYLSNDANYGFYKKI